MSGLDGVFLHLETPATPMHVAALYLIEPAADRERDTDFAGEIGRQLLPRLALAPFFRARLAPMPLQFANPVWIDGGVPDFSYHLRRIVLPAAASFADLEACVSGLHATLLDRRYPLWELAIIEGLASGEIGLYLKIHHAALDGVSGMALAGALFDATAEPAEVPADWRQQVGEAEDPGLGQRLGAIFRHTAAQYLKLARHLPAGLQLLTGMVRSAGRGSTPGIGQNLSFGPKTPLNVPITAARGFAALSLSLAGVKEIARRHGATVNDVVLALCSGALRRYLQAQGGLPRKSLIATMPVSLREAGNTETTIQATLTLVRLATHLADPLRRLRAVRAAAGAAKALTARARSIIPTDFPSLGVPWIVGGLAALYGRSGLAKAIPPLANLAISNVPGPRQPLTSLVAGSVPAGPEYRRARSGPQHHGVQLLRFARFRPDRRPRCRSGRRRAGAGPDRRLCRTGATAGDGGGRRAGENAWSRGIGGAQAGGRSGYSTRQGRSPCGS
ncbi:MAG: wax ester/triacylglycerol synthase family O-acyltransferase [Candidatus Accumulibacter sp.]|uniref:diacylglycerol O-acyltransferase n=1 Tax=Candidatus Accumulibacter proximus TaxID=2954385 RepID=A0A935Q1B5_9PROT|nr:wax ester/triacylglycerol synthase family O-acyltransferase [Candidatus Accumulibacter proximus]